jgi:DNA repair protein RadC
MGTLHTLPARERPVARLSYVGSGGVSQIELLAILIGGPEQLEIAQAVVQHFGDRLPHAVADELQTLPGIGQATAARIQAALELGRRSTYASTLERDQIRQPGDAARLLMPAIGYEQQECFAVLYLDTRNRVLEQKILYRGTLNTTMVRAAEVFRGAVRRNAASILVGHNHPSGDPSPSPEDRGLTRQLVQAGNTLELELVDHLIVGAHRWTSLRQDHGECWSSHPD